jgi:hypothetical protein
MYWSLMINKERSLLQKNDHENTCLFHGRLLISNIGFTHEVKKVFCMSSPPYSDTFLSTAVTHFKKVIDFYTLSLQAWAVAVPGRVSTGRDNYLCYSLTSGLMAPKTRKEVQPIECPEQSSSLFKGIVSRVFLLLVFS